MLTLELDHRLMSPVECSRLVGMGHRGGQLCHL